MTRSILEILAVVPGQKVPEGAAAPRLDPDQLGRYLREHCNKDGELGEAAKRAVRHAIRDEFYRDGGVRVMEGVVNKMFTDDKVKTLRKAWVPYARYASPVKRIVNDVSTVYDEPTIRRVGGDDANEAKYRALVEVLMLDEQMAEANRLVNLHRVILVGPRVRQNADDSWGMVLDFATPAVFRPVLHPTDGTLVVGWLIKCESRIRPDVESVRVAAWELWTDHEMMFLDDNFVPIGPPVAHGLGINRWFPMDLKAIALPGFWPGEEGEDLVAAAVASWFAEILLLKETKSATKWTTFGGDVSGSERAQPVDTETTGNVPDGVTLTTTDMSMDTEIFIRAADHALERVANAYGMSLAQVKYGAQSADAREAMLEPLRKIRRTQIKYARRWERQLAIRMSKVAAASKVAELMFTVEQWSQDFGEIQAITPFKQRMEEHVQARQIGIDNRVRFAMRENPDFTPEQALDFIAHNIMIETAIVALMKALMSIGGGTAPTAGLEGAPSPAPDRAAQGELPAGDPAASSAPPPGPEAA